MTKQMRIGLIVVAATLGTAVASSAMAAPRAFCETYAELAVNSYNQMRTLQLGCTGPRWHDWYDGHYRWCRSTSKASAASETMARKRAMFANQC